MSIIEDYKVLVKNGTEKILSNGGEWNKWLKFAGNTSLSMTLPAFRGDSRFSSWLYRLTTNAAIDFLRREKHHLGNLPLEEAPERTDPQQPELLAEQREQQEALQRALDQLSPEHRQVLLLRVVQQLSYDEIAQALSLESGTVKSRISRARRQLREILLRQGNFFPDSAVLPNGKEG